MAKSEQFSDDGAILVFHNFTCLSFFEHSVDFVIWP